MADAKLTALTAASALAGADLFYISQGGVSKKETHTQLLTLVGTTYVPLAGGTMTGALTISGDVGASLGNSIFSTKYLTNRRFDISVDVNGGYFSGYNTSNAPQYRVDLSDARVTVGSIWGYAWASGDVNAARDVVLLRDAAATLAQRNGTAQQIFRLYNTYTDASNYERLSLTGVAGASVNITAETLGTGGDNLDIVLTPAGNGSVVFPNSTYINSTGFGILSGIKCGAESSLNYYASGVRLLSSGEIAWTNTTLVNAPVDTALFRDSAGVVKVTDGGSNYRDLKLRNLLSTGYAQIDSGTLTASAPALSITQTWTTGAAFTAAKINVTDTLSTVGSLLQDWQVGGVSKASIAKDGTLTVGSNAIVTGAGYFSALVFGSSFDLYLFSTASGCIEQRNGITAQSYKLFGTYIDGANYQYLQLSANGTTGVTISAVGLGAPGANQDITLTPGGTGKVTFGTHSALAAETVTGYITIKDAGGTTRKLAVVS